MTHLTRNALSKLTGISIDTLRYYEKLKLIFPDYIKQNGYRYFCKSNIIKLVKYNFTKKIGMQTSEVVSLIKCNNLNDLEKNLLNYQNFKKKELHRIINHLKTINQSLKKIKNIKNIDLDNVSVVHGVDNIYETKKINSNKSVTDFNFLLELSLQSINMIEHSIEIHRNFSLNINLTTEKITCSKIFTSTFLPSEQVTKNSKFKKYIIVYFESNINSLFKDLIKRYYLLKAYKHHHSWSHKSLELIIISSIFSIDPSTRKLYALRLCIE